MAAPRKRTTTPGFTTPKKEEVKIEEALISELLDESAREMFETISRKEEEVVEEKPFVAQSIAPTPDPGPRFLDKEISPPAPAQKTPGEILKPKPVRRHPRNTPRFSACKDK
jgi:hypothetical protein